jgi:GNAT superfamily N-acetyltransferase
MNTITQADTERDIPHLRELLSEYIAWINTRLMEVYGMDMGDVDEKIAEDLQHLDKFLPPGGRLLLCWVDGNPAGTAGLKSLTTDVGEIKRMFVRPAYRQQGIGRAMLNGLIDAARQIGYRRLRLDSPVFMTDAHQLYRSVGFKNIPYYDEVEIPKPFRSNWIYMEKDL